MLRHATLVTETSHDTQIMWSLTQTMGPSSNIQQGLPDRLVALPSSHSVLQVHPCLPPWYSPVAQQEQSGGWRRVEGNTTSLLNYSDIVFFRIQRGSSSHFTARVGIIWLFLSTHQTQVPPGTSSNGNITGSSKILFSNCDWLQMSYGFDIRLVFSFQLKPKIWVGKRPPNLWLIQTQSWVWTQWKTTKRMTHCCEIPPNEDQTVYLAVYPSITL